MAVFLVQHGQSLPKDLDPAHPMNANWGIICPLQSPGGWKANQIQWLREFKLQIPGNGRSPEKP